MWVTVGSLATEANKTCPLKIKPPTSVSDMPLTAGEITGEHFREALRQWLAHTISSPATYTDVCRWTPTDHTKQQLMTSPKERRPIINNSFWPLCSHGAMFSLPDRYSMNPPSLFHFWLTLCIEYNYLHTIIQWVLWDTYKVFSAWCAWSHHERNYIGGIQTWNQTRADVPFRRKNNIGGI